ncbi:MAG: T9SS type A sorting domain-containing protein [candidate division Zixibacteria bacterium]|nr:T9SS type A sorting domain-containing protein [candidate division Zixibacteria bacterium]
MKISKKTIASITWLSIIGFVFALSSFVLADQGPTDYKSEYLIIVNEDLMCQAVDDLASWRTQQGYSVYIQEVNDGLTFYDIKDGIKRHYNPAYNSYQLLHVLLIGNACDDTLNWDIVNSATNNYIPSYWEWANEYDHTARMIAMDDVYARVDDDEPIEAYTPYLPDLYIGRIPAKNTDQVSIFINKLLDYEANTDPAAWKDNILVVAGDKMREPPCPSTPCPGGVRITSEDVIDMYVPQDWESKILYYTACPGDENKQLRSDSLALFLNDGQLIMSALGTGATQRNFCYYIESDYFDADTDLNNYLKYPVVYAASCDLGRFDPFLTHEFESHFENFLFTENAGAIAWISPSSATAQIDNRTLTTHFYKTFFEREAMNLGRLYYIPKFYAYNWQGAFQFNLYGDPGMQIAVNPSYKPAFSYTGFELMDTRALQNTVVDIANCQDVVARIIPVKHTPVRVSWISEYIRNKRVYGIKGEDVSPLADSRVYCTLMDDDIPINSSRRFLSFIIHVEESPGDLGHICLDGITKAGAWLHDLPIYSQFDEQIGPENLTVTSGEWRFYAFDLEPIYGKDISKLLIGYDDGSSAETGVFKAYIDEVKFSWDWGYQPYAHFDSYPEYLDWCESDSIILDIFDVDLHSGRGDSLTISWQTVYGTIDSLHSPAVIYTAPEYNGENNVIDTVTCLIEDRGLHVVEDTALILIGSPSPLDLPDKPSENFEVTCTPNPSNACFRFEISIPETSIARLEIYNLLGQKIDILINSQLNAGDHTVIWSASEYASGIYFYKLVVGDRALTKRMTLLK